MRVPENPTDFPMFQLAEPILAGLLRVIKRDIHLAVQMPTLAGEEKNLLGEMFLADKAHIDVAIAKREQEPFPNIIVRYERTEFGTVQGTGKNKRIQPNHVFTILCALVHENPQEATILMLRLLRAIYAIVERADVEDLWVMESPLVGIDLSKQCLSMTATPEGELGTNNRIVRRGTIVYQFTAGEVDARSFPSRQQTAKVTCIQ